VNAGPNARVYKRNFTEGSVITASRTVELQPLTEQRKNAFHFKLASCILDPNSILDATHWLAHRSLHIPKNYVPSRRKIFIHCLRIIF
jgi:hypothetical protein